MSFLVKTWRVIVYILEVIKNHKPIDRLTVTNSTGAYNIQMRHDMKTKYNLEEECVSDYFVKKDLINGNILEVQPVPL